MDLDRTVVSANLNLNFAQLENIFNQLELNLSPTIYSYKPTIERLVWYRNSIAHGENSITVTQKDIEKFINSELNCFDKIISILLGYATTLASDIVTTDG